MPMIIYARQIFLSAGVIKNVDTNGCLLYFYFSRNYYQTHHDVLNLILIEFVKKKNTDFELN